MKATLSIIGTISFATVLLAQTVSYSRPEEGLRYREVTTTAATITTAQGPFAITTSHDAVIALSFADGDSVFAAYESLQLNTETPMGAMRPDTAPIIGKPFILVLHDSGHVETIATPEVTQEISDQSALQWQFFDFFLTLPDDELRMGTTWSDSSRAEKGGTVQFWKAEFNVVGDTTVSGIHALVVDARFKTKQVISGPGPAPGMTAEAELNGWEAGKFYFAPSAGIMVGRSRKGGLSGLTNIIGGPAPMQLQNEMTYESTIELLSSGE